MKTFFEKTALCLIALLMLCPAGLSAQKNGKNADISKYLAGAVPVENGIILNGVPQGTPISIYTLGGNMICQKTSGGNTVSFSTSEPMVIAKIGNKSIKIYTITKHFVHIFYITYIPILKSFTFKIFTILKHT